MLLLEVKFLASANNPELNKFDSHYLEAVKKKAMRKLRHCQLIDV
jgi:hypothetical protein